MEQLVKFMGMELNQKWGGKFLLTLVFPVLLMILRPLALDLRQAILLGVLVLVVVWWSTGIIAKIPASIILLISFVVLQAGPVPSIFSFPLSETFFQIILTYVFSRGIAQSGLVEKLIEPRLFNWCKSPIKVIVAIIILYILTIYIIPQPLARLIIITNIIDAFLRQTDLPENSKKVLMFAGFSFYTVVNLALLDADIIMNHAALGFAGIEISNLQWAKYMLVPSIIYGSCIFGVFVFLFKKDLWGLKVRAVKYQGFDTKLSGKEKLVLGVIGLTVFFWMTPSLHPLSPVVVTGLGIVGLYLVKVIRLKDFLAIDISTLIFLTAAFSIGGAMKASGVADKVFGAIRFVLPANFGLSYLLVITLATMIMHMVLGSNVTTLSVVTPAFLVLTHGLLPSFILVYVLVITVSFHAILPFHNVAIMIGNSKGYYPVSYVSKLGLLSTPLVYLAILMIYYPWWRLLGL